MKKIIITFLACLGFISAHATGQVHDKLSLDGQVWEVLMSPLQALSGQANEQFLELLGERTFVSTANYRGYIAYWRVEKKGLYLEKVEMRQSDGSIKQIDYNLLKTALKKYRHRGKIRAGWLTGLVEIGKGVGPFNPENPYAPSFAEKKTLNIKKGRIKKSSL